MLLLRARWTRLANTLKHSPYVIRFKEMLRKCVYRQQLFTRTSAEPLPMWGTIRSTLKALTLGPTAFAFAVPLLWTVHTRGQLTFTLETFPKCLEYFFLSWH